MASQGSQQPSKRMRGLPSVESIEDAPAGMDSLENAQPLAPDHQDPAPEPVNPNPLVMAQQQAPVQPVIHPPYQLPLSILDMPHLVFNMILSYFPIKTLLSLLAICNHEWHLKLRFALESRHTLTLYLGDPLWIDDHRWVQTFQPIQQATPLTSVQYRQLDFLHFWVLTDDIVRGLLDYLPKITTLRIYNQGIFPWM